MHTLNTAQNHAIQTFSFRRPTRKDARVIIFEDVDGQQRSEVTELKHPVCVFHRNHDPKPVIPADNILSCRGARRFLACKIGSLLLKHNESGHGYTNSKTREHRLRMKRDQAAADKRRKGFLA